MSRGPNSDIIPIMDYALKIIQSVPYKVSLRWAFYRLLDKSMLSTKGDYTWFKNTQARWRKNFTLGWTPTTLKDDTRTVYYEGYGFKTKEGLLKHAIEDLPEFSHFYHQDFYVEIWFEARAMIDQFRYYTKKIPLRPFGGDYSIEPKWRAAEDLYDAYESFKKPIKILYFGDCDNKGRIIPYSAYKDIFNWCSIQFDFEVVGLTVKQAADFNLPQNPERPNQYQWESLTDEQAAKLIRGAISKYIDKDLIDDMEEKRQELIEELSEKLF